MGDFTFTEDDLDLPIDAESQEENNEGPRSYVATDVELEGTLHVQRGIDMAGHFLGNLQANHNITVNPTGHVQGEMEAFHICIEGRVDGEVTARKRLEILGEGRFIGAFTEQPEIITISENSVFGHNSEVAERFSQEYSRERTAELQKQQQENNKQPPSS